MAVEQYSGEVIVVAVADGASAFKVWLREEAPTDLVSDLQWLCEEYMDSHVVLDLAHMENLDAAACKLLLDLQGLVEESDYRCVLCSVSPHLKRQLDDMHFSGKFDTFDSRKAAILELAPQDAY